VSYAAHRSSSSRIVGFGVVLLLHAALIYGLVLTLAHRSIDIVHAPIETKIITETTPPPIEPPPPPPSFVAPPQVFVPPPEVNIAKPPPPPPRSTAPAVVTTAPPPTPARTAPVTAQPRIDLAHSSQPEYPPQSRRLSEQGSLVLQVMIDASGRVTDAKLVQSSGSQRLDQAALEGVKADYRFFPGTVDGKPQPMWFTFKFTWKLQS
jgi:periplasmic protein TonB